MAEKEYIERDRLYELGYWHGATPTLDNPFPDGVDAVDTEDIDSIPAADVRPVVTCDECIHRHEMDRQSCQGRRSDFFCADGKKREES